MLVLQVSDFVLAVSKMTNDRPRAQIEFIYNAVQLLFTWTSLANFYLAFFFVRTKIWRNRRGIKRRLVGFISDSAW